jgi:PAS domain S-box-containing protein
MIEDSNAGTTSAGRSVATGASFDAWAEFIEGTDLAIIGRSLDNAVLIWNGGAERMYGYSAGEIVGHSGSILMPPGRQDEADAILHRLASGEPVHMTETTRVAKGGRLLNISLTYIPTRDSAGRLTGFLTIAQDISLAMGASKALEEYESGTARHTLVLETAHRVALDILANRTGVEALRHIAEAARNLVHARYAALGVARPDGSGLIEFITTGLTTKEEAVIGDRPHGSGILGLLLQRTSPLRISVLADHPSSGGFPPNHPPMTSFLGVPIRRGDTVLGSLYLTDKEESSEFSPEDEVAVEALGAHAAVAIHNMQMLLRQRMLVSGLITAQEEERRSVAYDLHDGLTQYVMASHAHLESSHKAQLAGKTEKAARDFEQGMKYLKDAVIESRRLVNGLRSLALDDLGLSGAVEQLLAEEKVRAGWEEANLIHNISDRRFDRTVETAAYRVIQEALTNVRKHAGTARVQVAILAHHDDETGVPRLRAEIQDWGKGFVPEHKTGEYAHFGLHGMIERVQLIGGSHAIISTPGAGTTVRFIFPALEAQEPNENTGPETAAEVTE